MIQTQIIHPQTQTLIRHDVSYKRRHPSATYVTGERSSPIELLLLEALRYLGRESIIDNLEECTPMYEETHRQFFHKFIEFGSTALYNEYVKWPTDEEDYSQSQRHHDVGGLTRPGFSTDATNVIMWRCNYNLRQANMGVKQNHPARTTT
jgi:hypothetical protein